MSCDLRARGSTAPIRRRLLFVPLLAVTLVAGYGASAAGQPIQLVLDGALEIRQSPNFEALGLEEGDPVRFIVEFDPASPTGKVDRLLIQLDGTTFTNSTNWEYGDVFRLASSPDTGFEFSVVSGDIFHGARNGFDLSLFTVSAVQIAFELQSDEFSTSAGFPLDLMFEDLNRIDSGFFGLYPESSHGGIFTIEFSDLSVHVIPESGVAGDFNDDGNVDAADYVVWRKNDGGANALANDDDLGTPIRAEHYNLWRAHFGEIEMPDIAAGGQIPEPGSFVLAAAGLALAVASSTARRYRRCAACFALWAKNAGEQAFRGLRRRG
jgi:hypothetical protein